MVDFKFAHAFVTNVDNFNHTAVVFVEWYSKTEQSLAWDRYSSCDFKVKYFSAYHSA